MTNFIQVALPLPLDQTFVYAITSDQTEQARPGCRARVPFGKREMIGVIVEDPIALNTDPPRPPLIRGVTPSPGEISNSLPAQWQLRQVIDLPDPEPLLGTDLLELTRWISQYYLCSWGETLKAALPAGNLSLTQFSQRRKVRIRSVVEALSEKDMDPLPTPNEDQSAAVEAIASSLEKVNGRTFLLYGVTGSGKTLVYQKAVTKAMELGGSALVLIPEISLTPQILGRFRSNFGERVALQHSAMSVSERAEVWHGIRTGQYSIVLGARSAVFAPLTNLKLIVVDEEGDSSFKQNEPNPRYNARDVALVRAKITGATTVLGSATPSVESFHNAMEGRYTCLELPRRVDGVPPPKIKFTRPALVKNRALGPELERAVIGRIQRGEQVILLQNRRGFFTFVLCPGCGNILRCRHCDVSLAFHRAGPLRPDLRCHICGFRSEAPMKCASCGADLRYQGTGTQRVEDELARFMPLEKVVRLDLDSTARRGSHQRILQGFAREQFAVMLGTKMVARGHDYPKVTLVGIVSADTEMAFPDFRCDERAFALFLQAAGRAGRASLEGAPGEVLIQTWFQKHPVLDLVQKGDYRAFYDREIRLRQSLNYPPLGWMVLYVFTAKKEEKAHRAADDFARLAAGQFSHWEWLGPAPAYHARLKDRFRYHVVMKAPRPVRSANSPARQRLKEMIAAFREKLPASVHFSVDVDPMQLV